MDGIPNEVMRLCFEHLVPQQRIAIARVSGIWRYLIATFVNFPKSYTYSKTIYLTSRPYKIKIVDDNLVIWVNGKKLFYNPEGFLFQTLSSNKYHYKPNYKVGIDLFNGNIMVPGERGSIIEIFDRNGKHFAEFYILGKESSSNLGNIISIIVLKCRLILIIRENGYLQILNNYNIVICQFGGPTCFSTISDVREDSLGNLYISNYSHYNHLDNKVVVYTPCYE